MSPIPSISCRCIGSRSEHQPHEGMSAEEDLLDTPRILLGEFVDGLLGCLPIDGRIKADPWLWSDSAEKRRSELSCMRAGWVSLVMGYSQGISFFELTRWFRAAESWAYGLTLFPKREVRTLTGCPEDKKFLLLAVSAIGEWRKIDKVFEDVSEVTRLSLHHAKGNRPDDLVTRAEICQLLKCSPKTLSRKLNAPNSSSPNPFVTGSGRGKPDQWSYRVIHPWLEKVFGTDLPEIFPSSMRLPS
jgi:hypothetical protein